MSQGEGIGVRPGGWVFVVNKENGEVIRGRYVGEVEKFFLVKVPVVLRQGLERVVCSFDKERWGLVRGAE